VRLVAPGSTTSLGWDADDRNLTVRTTGSDPADIGYVRDASDRIIRRAVAQGDISSDELYSHTGAGDSADLVLAASDKKLLSRTISLPGGVIYTMRFDGAATTLGSADDPRRPGGDLRQHRKAIWTASLLHPLRRTRERRRDHRQ
jgi:hypothetical protein